ncbi:DEAD/DEAH box helicase, partial [Candidatus Bipolaricaulota bacterium]|nr:DEAD/DEAH box helicase [Candidatus Bipolaricaulota bacterium]
MPIERVLAKIEAARWYRGQVVHSDGIPATPSQHGTTTLHPDLQAYLDRKGIALYKHQAEAIVAFRGGRDVAITTPTASGKTLAFNLPVLETMIEDPEACALYLYPLKALANDQLGKLDRLIEACPVEIDADTYDGDTPTTQKARIKRSSRIVLTNPHALYHYLPWHHQWARIFANLRVLVLDEAHQYRGVFGANVGFLLRRTLRIARHYGAKPQVVLSSASIANPEEFARALTGRNAVSILEDTSEHGRRDVLFWDPLQDPTRSVTTQVAQLLALLTESGIQTICFARSRASAEVIAQAAQRAGGRDIVPYRAGYLPAER